MLHLDTSFASKWLIPAVALTASLWPVEGRSCEPGQLDVLPAVGVVLLDFGGQQEEVQLSSDPQSPAVTWTMPDEGGDVPSELVGLNLTGYSSLAGRVELRAGRALGLPPSNGRALSPLEPPYQSFFDIFVELNLPDVQVTTTGIANSVQVIHFADRVQVAGELAVVMHPERRCNLGTRRCDIPSTGTCAELFQNGQLLGCCSSP